MINKVKQSHIMEREGIHNHELMTQRCEMKPTTHTTLEEKRRQNFSWTLYIANNAFNAKYIIPTIILAVRNNYIKTILPQQL